MDKNKKKDISDKIPKPIKIKKEKTEEDRTLQSMTHYIDDRLELVKQVFGTLKPKTILNLAPEFLKVKEMEDIQELCLNELLGISTKRLLSIINSTKCPSDTDSSSDSDVEHEEEQVPLEEVSSDSDNERGKSKSKRVKKSNGTANAKGRKKADTLGQEKQQDNAEESDPKGDGQISVLELLELQARARAIRSQLALEPVTKIEVDDDDEIQADACNRETNGGSKDQNSRKRKTSEQEKSSTSHNQANANENEGQNGDKLSSQAANEKESSKDTNSKEKEKKIKLKRRNYNTTNTQNEKLLKERQITENNDTETNNKEIKTEKERDKERSITPDVIPIVVEPETLSITDSSDSEEPKKRAADAKKPLTNSENSAIGKEIKQEKLEKPKQVLENNLKEEDSTSNIAASQSDKDDGNKSVDQEDDRDDVISLGGGDLETEMSEHLKDDGKVAKANKNQKESNVAKSDCARADDADVISLSEEDENNEDSESWRSRYVRSSKVSKVLAESRLGKRMRDKIKSHKRSSKTKDSSANESECEKSKSYSKHEDGSVEQYKELLEMRQRKNSTTSAKN